MIDFSTDLGKRALERLDDELCIWLTTTGSDGTPQPRPVWFEWDEGEFVVYAVPGSAKLRHIAANPRVAVHFDGGREGDDIQVFTGTARVVPTDYDSPSAQAYFVKYAQDIPGIGMTEASFKTRFSQTIRIKPDHLR